MVPLNGMFPLLLLFILVPVIFIHIDYTQGIRMPCGDNYFVTCLKGGEPCKKDVLCCGDCLEDKGICCMDNNQPCEADGDCCSKYCNMTAKRCDCVGIGKPCMYNTNCCTNFCSDIGGFPLNKCGAEQDGYI